MYSIDLLTDSPCSRYFLHYELSFSSALIRLYIACLFFSFFIWLRFLLKLYFICCFLSTLFFILANMKYDYMIQTSGVCTQNWKPRWTTKAKIIKNNVIMRAKRHFKKKKKLEQYKSFLLRKEWLNSIELLLGVLCHFKNKKNNTDTLKWCVKSRKRKMSIYIIAITF